MTVTISRLAARTTHTHTHAHTPGRGAKRAAQRPHFATHAHRRAQVDGERERPCVLCARASQNGAGCMIPKNLLRTADVQGGKPPTAHTKVQHVRGGRGGGGTEIMCVWGGGRRVSPKENSSTPECTQIPFKGGFGALRGSYFFQITDLQLLDLWSCPHSFS